MLQKINNSFTFGAMHVRTGYKRTLMALLHVAVMLWVHAIKCFHTHEPDSHPHHHHAIATVVEDDDHHACAICEFQPAKEAALTTGFEHRQFTCPQTQCCSQLPALYGTGYSCTGGTRGPPTA